MTNATPTKESTCRRIYYVDPRWGRSGDREGPSRVDWESLCEKAAALGFDSILTPPLWSVDRSGADGAPDDPAVANGDWFEAVSMEDALADLSNRCARHQLSLLMDLVLDRAVANGLLARAEPGWYDNPRAEPLDPRRSLRMDRVHLRLRDGRAPAGMVASWSQKISGWIRAGVAGFRCLAPASMAPEDWAELIRRVRREQSAGRFMAWTPGMTPGQLEALTTTGFDATFLSLPWWDYRASWLVEEHDRLRAVAPVIAPVIDPAARPMGVAADASPASHFLGNKSQAIRRLQTAAFTGNGILVPMGYEDVVGTQAVLQANQHLAHTPPAAKGLRMLSGPLAAVTALFRNGKGAQLLLINPDDLAEAQVNWQSINARMLDSYTLPDRSGHDLPAKMAVAGCSLFSVARANSVRNMAATAGDKRKSVTAALRAPRIAIESVSPAVDEGRFAVKRTLGERIEVRADIFMDGHESIAASLLWRAVDETAWQDVQMVPMGNDRWVAEFSPGRLGRHCYTIKAWADTWHTFTEQLQKKSDANQDVSLDVEEGRITLQSSLEYARNNNMPEAAATIAAALREVGEPQGGTVPGTRPRRIKRASAILPASSSANTVIPPARLGQTRALLSKTLAAAMAVVDTHPFEVTCDIAYPLVVERREARFASWYELFPRSQSTTPGKHGTFMNVIDRLPAIRDMGFDVLYFPPIHPIGTRNRKGRNNALKAGPDDPGSPYAIGSDQGGHDAVHPQLGSLSEFRQLIEAAHEHGLEVAMDFAVQCAPDHPWLAEHPEWFDWRVDGSLRYAENPPKRYEDIVNPDFYSSLATPHRQAALWTALCDIILFWIGQGVHTFRVDNPHTKPLPFWHWMIGHVQSLHPDTVFLSEAFTRPRMMYRLAKEGFSQSYTYFTWRNNKREIMEYLTELNTAPVADFFRPNFFVNTPDINPYFLQTSGRPGFLIRAALATTTSGLWGMYNGFELCEAQSMPGKEEYLNSEKYEIRSWDWSRPGNIVREITRLNQVRRTNPALQTHLGLRFHSIDNDRILFYSKSAPEGDNVVLVILSLDPHAAQAGTLELPLWQWGLADDAGVHLQELADGRRFFLQGKHHYVELTPQRPYVLWRLMPPG